MRALVCLLLLAAPAGAAERRAFVSSFERVRVEGPFQVTLTTGRSPAASVSADPRQLDRVEVRQDGTTLIVRRVVDTAADTDPGGAVAVTLATGRLASATVIGGGQITIAGGVTPRLDLSVAGSGAIALTGADTEQATATVVGSGQITIAGRAARARLTVNGTGKVLADGLDAGELTVLVDGPGEALARARYTATVTNTGLGHVAVGGAPKCTVRAAAGGPVTCGVTR